MTRLLAAAFSVLLVAAGTARQPAYDLVIRNARIVDGTGAPWYRGEVAIRGDAIVRARNAENRGSEDSTSRAATLTFTTIAATNVATSGRRRNASRRG